MAKQSITQPTFSVNNIQSLPTVVKNQATSLKQTFDKVGLDIKDYLIALLAEINGNDGSKKIGHNSLNISSDNVNDALEELYTSIATVVLGEIPNNSITNAKLGTDVKIGSLAELITTDKTSVVNAINEILAYVNGVPEQVDVNEIELDILRKFNPTTGSNVALAVDTAGVFDLTINGNILNITPNVTNVGAMTINPDSQGAKAIKKFDIATDSFIDVEAEDIKKSTPTSLSWSLSNDFFVLAPKGGSNIKSIQRGTATLNAVSSLNVSISSVNSQNSIVRITEYYDLSSFGADDIGVTADLTTDTNIFLSRVSSTGILVVKWEVIEFNNVKSKQKGTFVAGAATVETVSISSVNRFKSLLFTSVLSDQTDNNFGRLHFGQEITNDTTLTFYRYLLTAGARNINWQVIEFK